MKILCCPPLLAFGFASAAATLPAFAAAVLPPVVSKSFSPAVVSVNQLSTMTITITNPNDTFLTGASLNDFFPGGLVIAGSSFPRSVDSTCGSESASAASADHLNMSGGSIPGNGNCTITVPVFSATPGAYENSTTHVFSSGPASLTVGIATLEVRASIPALSPLVLVGLAFFLGTMGIVVIARRA